MSLHAHQEVLFTWSTKKLLRRVFLFYAANYTVNSTYQRNLDATLSVLPETNNGFGFYNLSTGLGTDTVNSAALCRGDVIPELCRSCVNDSIVMLRKLCPNQVKAIGYYDYCFLEYSNETVLGGIGSKYNIFIYNIQNTTDAYWLNAVMRRLLSQLIDDAAAGGPLQKFATGNTTGPDFINFYALVQCTPDISEQQCRNCLEDATNLIPQSINWRVGGRVLQPMCNFRYQTYRFFNQSAQLISPPPILQPSPSIPPPPSAS
ncbi:hypothetical protein L1987_47017 [Smallanthus sonchifolius]|uniref:Uncharacterized protein n=1 Tax=Smallanthus sonchifolius TaxID=185202 RepID=A0ACB9G2C9_9ASTR|nr:hypothetical protein L1987_47017 [Smallanthus sonchifolius]